MAGSGGNPKPPSKELRAYARELGYSVRTVTRGSAAEKGYRYNARGIDNGDNMYAKTIEGLKKLMRLRTDTENEVNTAIRYAETGDFTSLADRYPGRARGIARLAYVQIALRNRPSVARTLKSWAGIKD